MNFKQWLLETDSPKHMSLLLREGPFYHYTKQPNFRPNAKHVSQSLAHDPGLYASKDPMRWIHWAKENGYQYVALLDLSEISEGDIAYAQAMGEKVFGNEEEVYIPTNLFDKVRVLETRPINTI